jgi:hypothetical protein
MRGSLCVENPYKISNVKRNHFHKKSIPFPSSAVTVPEIIRVTVAGVEPKFIVITLQYGKIEVAIRVNLLTPLLIEEDN